MESFNQVYTRMLESYTSLTGNTPTEESDIAIRLKVLAGEIIACQMNLDFIKNQTFIETASGEYLDYHGGLRGLTRKNSVKAKGYVTFKLESALTYSVPIPKGTLVATSGGDAQTFQTDEDAEISIGKTFVTVACTATQGGGQGNVSYNKINVLVDSVADIYSVTNTDAFTGGVDVESDEDFKARILDSVVNVSNGTNTAYYKKLALSIDGVSSAYVVALGRGAGTVDIYICSYGEVASDELVAEVQALMDEKREINSDVKVYAAKPYGMNFYVKIVPKSGYDFNYVAEEVRKAVEEFVKNLGAGEDYIRADLSEKLYHIDGLKNFYIPEDMSCGYATFISSIEISVERA